MRLLNTHNLQFKDFPGEVSVPYAILSHRWEAENNEVSYKDHRRNLKKGTPGHDKIRRLCEIARKDDLNWAWIDTCCIDKRSSAELTQSINSMYSWYEKATKCYAYLKDVESGRDLEKSKWWKRGWTLQELIAPASVTFYTRDWHKVGTKNEMASRVTKITGIPSAVLFSGRACMRYCVAQRMSWAEERQTTCIEDRAYSLLGLFRINMPLLYGEGLKAFQRLQLAILKKYPDESILAWMPRVNGPHYVLADDPDDFRECRDLVSNDMQGDPSPHQLDPDPRRENPPRVTSWGLEICANARRLVPRREIVECGQSQKFLWAVTLTMAWDGRIKELPCTIILVRSGPAPYSYKRLECYPSNSQGLFKHLKTRYHVGDLELDRLFYLLFDKDFEF